MNSYQIIRYQPEHRAAVLELLTHLWGNNRELNGRTFSWKYEKNPYLVPPVIYLALYQNVPVAMRGFFGTLWEMRTDLSETVIVPCAVDTVIHPDHRNTGLFRMIMDRATCDLAAMGYTFMLNLSASPIVHLSSLAMGWKSVGPVDEMIYERSGWSSRVENKLIQLLKRFPGIADMAMTVSARLLKPAQHAISRDSPYVLDIGSTRRVCTESRPRPEAMAQLVRQVPLDRFVRHEKNQEFFEWRFNNPRSRYRFVFLEQGEALLGYIVLQYSTVSYQRRANIVDWETIDELAFHDLLKAIIRIVGLKGIHIGDCVLSGESRRTLASLRFVEMERPQSLRTPGHSILVKLLENVNETKANGLIGKNLLDIQAWELRNIFSDAV